jgi:hypothetical protein
MFLDNLPKMYEIGNINCATHFELDWEYITTMVEKIRELLWPIVQPFMQNGELCFICCSPFGPKGTWLLSTIPSAMFNTLMMARICP